MSNILQNQSKLNHKSNPVVTVKGYTDVNGALGFGAATLKHPSYEGRTDSYCYSKEYYYSIPKNLVDEGRAFFGGHKDYTSADLSSKSFKN